MSKDLDDSDVSEKPHREWDRHPRNLSAHSQDYDLIAAVAMEMDGFNEVNVGLNRSSDRELTTDDDEEISASSCAGDLDNEVIADDDVFTGGGNELVSTMKGTGNGTINEW